MWSCRKGARRRGGPRRGSSRRQCFLPFARRGEGESHRLVSARRDRGGRALGGASIIVEAIALAFDSWVESTTRLLAPDSRLQLAASFSNSARPVAVNE